MKPLVKAVVVSPLFVPIGVLFSYLVFLMPGVLERSYAGTSYFYSLLLVSIVGILYAYLAVIFIGLPIHYFLWRFNMTYGVLYVAGSLIVISVGLWLNKPGTYWWILLTNCTWVVSFAFWYFFTQSEPNEEHT